MRVRRAYDPMMLELIVETTRRRISEIHHRTDEFRTRARDMPSVRPLREALVSDRLSVIAEFKRRSPSRGVLAADIDPAIQAKAYEAGGAAAISVLTEPDHFDGSDADLMAAHNATTIPTLRKDFTLDDSQIWQARAIGADAILLIVALLSDDQLAHLHGVAVDAGLDAVVEVHSTEEASRALAVSPTIVGVNNRDLRTFQVDLATSESIAPLLAGVPVTVGESGIFTPADAARMRHAGYDAVLVGESLIRSGDPAAAIRELSVA